MTAETSQPPSLLPGLSLSLGVAAVAYLLGLQFPLVGGPVFAILIGLMISSLHRPPLALKPGLQFASKQLLQLAIILLGFGMSLRQVFVTGQESLAVMLSTLLVCLLAAWFLGRAMRVEPNLIALVGAGTAICGASAIAAVAPVVRAEERQVAYAISTIFAFNVVAVLSFPALGHLLGFSQQAFGLWAGTAVNDTSSVVAAAYAFGADAGAYATVVKLARSIMIIPIVLGLSALLSLRAAQQQSRIAWTRLIPWFIVWFLVSALAVSVGLVPPLLMQWLPLLGRFLIIVALAAVGLNADVGAIARTGWRPLALGAILWVLVAATSVMVQRLVGQI
ncbi:MAG: YeiH family protein [Bacillota bacterium]